MNVRDTLREFINGIKNQNITLRYIEFEANPNVEGIFVEGDLKRIFEITEISVSGADVRSTLDEEDKKSKKALLIEYKGNYRDSLILSKKIVEKEEEELLLVNVRFAYVIKLLLKEDNIIFSLKDNDKETLLEAFVNNTGKLMIFPYLRHLIHMLSFEAGFYLPPLKPLLIK